MRYASIKKRWLVSQQKGSSSVKQIVVLLILVFGFSYISAYWAKSIRDGHEPRETTHRTENESERIKPVGAVATDSIVATADDIVTPAVVEKTVIEKPPFDPEAIYKTACFACHDTGAADAPKLEAGAWTDRLAKGEDALVASAINGIGMMPPKGGAMALSDEEIAAIVGYMLAIVQE